MSELEPQAPGNDPIASLHKMSTTAGVGNQEYVAINNLAVASAFMGIATALGFLGLPFLLAAAASIVCGGVALRQIHRSAGTQGGRGVALLGIGLSLLLAGTAIGMNVKERLALRRDEDVINAVISQLSQHVISGDYAQAYALTHEEFRKRVSLSQFATGWTQQRQLGGALRELRGNGVFQFGREGNGTRTARTQAIVRFVDGDAEGRMDLVFVQLPDGLWRAVRISLFDAADTQ